MRIARVNVYLSDELARAARLSGLNVSAITQDAVRGRLAGVETDRWLDRLAALPATDISHERALEALADAPAASTGAGTHD